MLFKIQHKLFTKYLLTISLIVGGYFVLIVYDNYLIHSHKTLCMFKLITGIPCPGCGMGRATLELFNGNISQSFQYNILCIPFTIGIVSSLFWMIFDLINNKETFFCFLKMNLKSKYKILLISIIMIDWSINIIRRM
ncbi:hypothetical protein LBMAG27_22550 [Bacteroidota bacterium]|nr:hypothetical protein LBMAG27_22550 [Bacteroidota bacterium]